MYEVVPCREVGMVLRSVSSTPQEEKKGFPFSVSSYVKLLPVSLCPPLRYLSGRVFILDLMPGSQAHVDRLICPGDILDEINGTSLRNSKNGQVKKCSNADISPCLLRNT